MTHDELLDHSPLRGGKHPGKTPSEVAEKDPGYIVWAYETWSNKPCSALLYQACKTDFDEELRQRRVSRDQNDND